MSTKEIVPVPCPVCGQRQNRAPGPFDPDREPFGPVFCMACGHAFTRDEYHAGWRQALRDSLRDVSPRLRPRR
jgi:hypothetical protein